MSKLYLNSLKDGTCGNTSFDFIVHQNSCILVANDNTYLGRQRMKAYFVELFVHPKFIVVCN
jgi:hypothetical protein